MYLTPQHPAEWRVGCLTPPVFPPVSVSLPSPPLYNYSSKVSDRYCELWQLLMLPSQCRVFVPLVVQKKIWETKGPTCCPAVFADGEFKLLLDRCNLKVVIHSVHSLWAQAQVKPQLVLGRSVGELIDLIQTWGKSKKTEKVDASRNSLYAHASTSAEHR